ncbi:hypothetical protein RvY_09487 [Ramazzottius varieornatus]|uniref:Mitogen-activated protein kinase kinase kinase 7 n=1 Tax=Ramazzottius varieornatus TaxID=947166 RepID=A0A1D1V9J0_RAMVA|nr:hypothetical protein RvY_09487 [Ramazzottius varieornatus]
MGSLLEDIPYRDLQFKEVVGRGSFGVVYRAKWKGQIVAIKRAETETELQSFRMEVQQLQRVCHPNIITILGVSSDESQNPLCLVMEFADCGSLYNLLHGEDIPQYSCSHAVSWLLQCARGVAYLHNMRPKPLIHRDLKPPNILLTDSGRQCKLCDFGTACEARTYLTNNRGSAAWMAPEVFESNKYTEKCDVFSFGIIIWEVLTRRRPYDEAGGNIYRIMWAIHRGIRPPLIRGCPALIETLMTQCWAKDPQERPRMIEVVKILEIVFKKLHGASLPVQWKKSNKDLPHVRSDSQVLKKRDGSLERRTIVPQSTPAQPQMETVLCRSHDAQGSSPLHKSQSDDTICHSNTLNIIPVVEAEAEPSVRYTTLHEHQPLNRSSVNRLRNHLFEMGLDEHLAELADFMQPPRYNYSSTVEFGSGNSLNDRDDHGFVEFNTVTTSSTQRGSPTRIASGGAVRPVTLDFIGPSSSGMRLSFKPSQISTQIDMRASPAVRRLQSLTLEMSSPPGSSVASPVTTVFQRHFSYGSGMPSDTDDDDTCHSISSLPPHFTVRELDHAKL